MRAVFAFIVVAVVASCGPSTAQIKEAKAAEYKAPAKQVLDVALQVAQLKYKIGVIDPDALKFATAPQWYTREGGRISPNNDGNNGDFVNAGGGDIQVSLIVAVHLVPLERVVVSVTPKTYELIVGSPQPRELQVDDPNLPPWVLGRADTLALAIHKHAKQYIEKP
jgi:hypothetical protein